MLMSCLVEYPWHQLSSRPIRLYSTSYRPEMDKSLKTSIPIMLNSKNSIEKYIISGQS
jgi:hypothetical protein